MGVSWGTRLLTLCICHGYLTSSAASEWSSQPSALAIDKLVTTWPQLGFSQYTFLGTWHNETYLATVWLRLIPTGASNEREVRTVTQLTRAHSMFKGKHDLHVVTPKEFLKDDKLPAITFTAASGHDGRPVDMAGEPVVVQQQYWNEYLKSGWLAGVINGRAVLKADTQYTLGMEGAERLYQIPAFRSSKTHAMFKDGDAWIGMVDTIRRHRRPQPFRFLVLQHLRHHLHLGFRGTLLVVVADTAAMLLADASVREAVEKHQLVLVLWDHGEVKGKTYIMQLPANNLLMAAMAGTNTTLGLWDLDEYLVLPSRRSISYEVNQGCLTQLHNVTEMEAVVSFAVATTTSNTSEPGNDITQWLEKGSFKEAMKSMQYTLQPLKSCNDAIYCKALVNPNGDFNMHVHQLARPPPATSNRKTTGAGCAYMLNFLHLYKRRGFWSKGMLSKETAPLKLEELGY